MSRYPARRPDSGGRSTVFGTRGAVACEHPLAALAGIRTLDNGGNAADACVAMAASMTVLAPIRPASAATLSCSSTRPRRATCGA